MLELHTTCALAVWSGTLPEVVVPRWNYTGEPQLYCTLESHSCIVVLTLNERLTTQSVANSQCHFPPVSVHTQRLVITATLGPSAPLLVAQSPPLPQILHSLIVR
jgi:hypothetical protein